MLLGCCHCDSYDPPSESDSSSSGIETVIRTGCAPNDHRCLGDEAPAVFGIHVESAPGTKRQCYAAYIGDFAVYLLTANPALCWNYQSVEYIKIDPGTAPCNDDTSTRRWTVGIGVNGGNTRITVSCLIRYAGFVSLLGSWRYTASGLFLNCVNSFTCTKTSTDTFGYPMPTTVTITPL